jgi:hypothetical protein
LAEELKSDINVLLSGSVVDNTANENANKNNNGNNSDDAMNGSFTKDFIKKGSFGNRNFSRTVVPVVVVPAVVVPVVVVPAVVVPISKTNNNSIASLLDYDDEMDGSTGFIEKTVPATEPPSFHEECMKMLEEANTVAASFGNLHV